MIMVYAVVKLISPMTNVIHVKLVILTFLHVKVSNNICELELFFFIETFMSRSIDQTPLRVVKIAPD